MFTFLLPPSAPFLERSAPPLVTSFSFRLTAAPLALSAGVTSSTGSAFFNGPTCPYCLLPQKLTVVASEHREGSGTARMGDTGRHRSLLASGWVLGDSMVSVSPRSASLRSILRHTWLCRNTRGPSGGSFRLGRDGWLGVDGWGRLGQLISGFSAYLLSSSSAQVLWQPPIAVQFALLIFRAQYTGTDTIESATSLRSSGYWVNQLLAMASSG